MRRGLMAWNADELPRQVLEERIARLQAAMQSDRLDGFLLYTNLVQPNAVTWLTGFTPYWSDGLLMVPKAGAPIFATALSKRVADWIASTNPVSEIVNTPRPGSAVGKRLAADGGRRLGVLELDRLPGGLFDEIADAAPGIELVDASARFARLRSPIDATERRLIAHADAIAVAALGEIDPTAARDAGAIAGVVEKHARLAGAEEAYIAVAGDLDADTRPIRVSGARPLGGRFALRASIAYKGSWVRCTRTFAKDAAGAAALARADAWFEALISAITAGKPVATQVEGAVAKLPGASLKSFLAESAIGSYPLQAVAASGMTDAALPVSGAFLVLTLALTVDGVPWLGAAPIFVP
jgi:Xaa-Pro aminopeptidase